MRYKFIGAACLALLIGGGIANANVDFDDLLDSLSFADDTSTPKQENQELAEEIPPPPPAPQNSTSQPLDGLLDSDLQNSGIGTNNDSLRTIPELPNRSLTPYSLNETAEIDGPDAFQPEPLPYTPVVPGSEKVDLDALVTNFSPAPQHSSAGPFSVLEQGYEAAADAHAPRFQQCGHHHGCASPYMVRTPACLPAPVLPPPGNFNSIYRTPSWYRGLWAGYAEQKQQEIAHHPCLLGTCDCAPARHCPPSSHGGAANQCGCNACSHR